VTVRDIDRDSFVDTWAAWHRDHEPADPHGFLAITSLGRLDSEPARFEDAPDPRWSFSGRFLPFEAPRPVTVGAVVEGLQHVYDAAGQVEFERDHAPPHRFQRPAAGHLLVLFLTAYARLTVVPAAGH
jgi:hypothetical protein